MKIFLEIFRKKNYLDESRTFLTVTPAVLQSRPSVDDLPVHPTLLVWNFFLFYPFSQNFSFQNSLNSKNKKLFVCHQETFFVAKKIFYEPKFLRLWFFTRLQIFFWTFFLFLIQNEEIWESSVLIGWWQWQTDYVIN